MSLQHSSHQLNFLQDKIQQIGSAIFFNLSDSVLKLPTSIVSTLKVDDYGYVWFFVKKPKQHLQEFENGFPVRLDFFKKGSQYFLQVMGKGFVVNDPEEINTLKMCEEWNNTLIHDDTVLVKVKMMKAEYYETQSRANTSWWQTALNTVNTWFGTNPHVGPNIYFPAS
ncbi:MAG: pyridoxamine 5'-phosphate oxidase family protein [Chitinophagaceae bacterium]